MPNGVMGDEDYTPLSAIGQRLMTHEAEQPNPARPILDFYSNFAGGGLQKALSLPNNFIGRALQNPDNQAALGMATPLGSVREALFNKLLDAGKTNNEIASAMGLSPGTIASYKSALRPNELNIMKGRAKEATDRMFDQGESLGDILGNVAASTPPLTESNNISNKISDLLAMGSARTVKQNAQLQQLRARANEVDDLLERGSGPMAMPGAMTPEIRQEIGNLPANWTNIPLRKIQD